jgi:hypothetical protein
MIRHIFTILWNQRKQNGWLFVELTFVFIALWLLCDTFIARIYTYKQPLGYDIENCWRLSFGNFPPGSSDYVADTTKQLSPNTALLQILERLRRLPEVDDACTAIYASPYSIGYMYQPLLPIEADTAKMGEQSYHCYNIDLHYLNTFRVKDKYGNPIEVTAHPDYYIKGMLITPELEEDFFHGASAKGKLIRNMNGQEQEVAGVVNSIRRDDFLRPEKAFYCTYDDATLISMERWYSPNQLEVTVRMKQTLSQDQMNEFIAAHSAQLTAGNLYVIQASSWSEWRDSKLFDRFRQLTVFALLGVFTLITVFFGITGTFWLRVEQRRSEIGLRMTLGSTSRRMRGFFTAEGWLLLTAVLPLALVVIINLCVADLPDTTQMDMGGVRFVAGFFITLLLLGGMILIGTYLPARRVLKVEPAEALKYE